MAAQTDGGRAEGASASPTARAARPRTGRYGDGIPMDMLFRDEEPRGGGAGTGARTEGAAPVAPGPAQADPRGIALPPGAEPDSAKRPGRGTGEAGTRTERTDSAASAGEDGLRDDDTAEQPRVIVPLLDPDTGGPFRYEDEAPDAPEAGRARTGGPARPADVAVAGIAAATELLDTAERAALDGALAAVDGGGRAPGAAEHPRTSAAPQAPARPHQRLMDPSPDATSRSGGVRQAPTEDPDLAERRGPSLSGWLAVLIGLLSLGCVAALLWWRGALPAAALAAVGLPAVDHGPMKPWDWGLLALGGALALLAFGGLTRGRVGSAWVLSLFGRYRGSVRRTGLVWISPMVLRRRVDVRLRHWRSEAMPAVDADGIQLRVVVLVVWRIKDTARALLAVEDHAAYLREQVEAAMARVLSQLPADTFHGDAPTLRDAEAVGDALTRILSADCRPVGIEVFSAQPTRIEYAPEVAAAMQRRQIAALDAKHRDSVLTSVVDAVDDTVNRLTSRGLVELDDYERKALVKDLTVAFYTARGSAVTKS